MSESEHFTLERRENATGELLDFYLYRKIGKGKVLVGSIQSKAEAQEICELLHAALEQEEGEEA